MEERREREGGREIYCNFISICFSGQSAYTNSFVLYSLSSAAITPTHSSHMIVVSSFLSSFLPLLFDELAHSLTYRPSSQGWAPGVLPLYLFFVNPRRACAARVTVVVLAGACLCLSVCQSVTTFSFSALT